jgi:hypothetical protein
VSPNRGSVQHDAVVKDEYGFRYDAHGDRIDAKGRTISPHTSSPKILQQTETRLGGLRGRPGIFFALRTTDARTRHVLSFFLRWRTWLGIVLNDYPPGEDLKIALLDPVCNHLLSEADSYAPFSRVFCFTVGGGYIFESANIAAEQ